MPRQGIGGPSTDETVDRARALLERAKVTRHRIT
jgi:hypothetical protein